MACGIATLFEPMSATQMFVPSNASASGWSQKVYVPTSQVAALSLVTVLDMLLPTQISSGEGHSNWAGLDAVDAHDAPGGCGELDQRERGAIGGPGAASDGPTSAPDRARRWRDRAATRSSPGPTARRKERDVALESDAVPRECPSSPPAQSR